MIEEFVNFCRNNLDLNSAHYAQPYKSLSVCILDCVYSLQARYFSTTVPVVERYAAAYMNGDRFAAGDTLEDFMNNINAAGGYAAFASNVLHNNQRLARQLKSQVCYELARKLRLLHINTKEDFKNFDSVELLEIVINSVKGMGTAGLNYLFMLAGDPNRCKPDVHIHHCIRDACGRDVSDNECQTLLTDAVAVLRNDYQYLTVALLDSIIWQKYQIGNRNH